MRRITFVSLLLALVAGACSSGAEPQPGTFTGDGADGFTISITVNSNLEIPELAATFSCGRLGNQQTITFDPPSDVSGGSFDLEFRIWELSGKFEGDGTEASGTWSSGDCSGSWQAALTG